MDQLIGSVNSAPQVKKSKKKLILSIIGVTVLILAIFLIPAVVSGLKISNSVYDSWNESGILLENIKSGDWDSSAKSADLITGNIKSINSDLAKLGPIAWLPKIRQDIKVVRQFISVSQRFF
jgi:hypothetical protein